MTLAPDTASHAVVWCREAGAKPVWHIAAEPLGDGWFRTACHWELRLQQAPAIWPQKAREPGPAPGNRCPECTLGIGG